MTISSVLEDSIVKSVKQALIEDIGNGDLTAQSIQELIPEKTIVNASIVAREAAVFCGQFWANEVFRQLNPDITVTWFVSDGDTIQADQVICEISGPSREVLSGERTALNFLQTLSGTATRTRQYVQAVEGTATKILDTRKTIPGMRLAQKYAVTCGGGENHRVGLYDGILIKENHIEAAGSLENAISSVLLAKDDILVEIEVETLEQLKQALKAGVKRLLLDNMTLEQLRQAVEITAKKAQLEASGNVSLDNVRDIAGTGVDYISIGDLTKNIRAVDLSLRIKD